MGIFVKTYIFFDFFLSILYSRNVRKFYTVGGLNEYWNKRHFNFWRTITRKVKELALQIERDFEGEEIVVIAVLKGSFVFAADLIRHIKNDVTIDFISASSYGNQTETTGKVKLLKDIDVNITGKT